MTKPSDPAHYRALMRRVEEVVAHIEAVAGERLSIHSVADEIICKLRNELGIYGGRLYKLDGDSYRLQATFPDAREVAEDIRIPRSYPPIEICLMRGSVYMEPGDPLVDLELEESLGVKEFAAVEVGNERFILGFNVEPGHNRDEILFSLGVVRHSINRMLLQQDVDDLFQQARWIQTSIMPREAPRFGNYDIAGRSRSLESVGGDLFDFIPITENILGLAIADASGHGLPAALQVRDIYTGLRMGLGRDFKIVRTVERLNDIIHASTLTSRFVSMFYGELERTGAFIGVNAGHPPPFHISREGEVQFLEEGGPVLGPLRDANYDRCFVQMRPGDLLVLYTDGISEILRGGLRPESASPDQIDDEYGVERLVEAARANLGKTAEEVIDAIFADLESFTGATQLQDDATLVVVVYPENPSP